MDDTTKNSNDQLPISNNPQVGQGINVAPQQNTVQQQNDQQSQPPAQPQQIQQPVSPMGSMHKEAGPVAPSDVEYTMTPSEAMETKPDLDQEVKEAGVEQSVNPEDLQLNEEHASVGIEPAKESIPMLQTQTQTASQIKNAPFSQDEANQILKTTPTDDTKHWLAVLFLLLCKKMHLATTA